MYDTENPQNPKSSVYGKCNKAGDLARPDGRAVHPRRLAVSRPRRSPAYAELTFGLLHRCETPVGRQRPSSVHHGCLHITHLCEHHPDQGGHSLSTTLSVPTFPQEGTKMVTSVVTHCHSMQTQALVTKSAVHQNVRSPTSSF